MPLDTYGKQLVSWWAFLARAHWKRRADAKNPRYYADPPVCFLPGSSLQPPPHVVASVLLQQPLPGQGRPRLLDGLRLQAQLLLLGMCRRAQRACVAGIRHGT